jgi:hypothetical protein
MTTQQRKPLPPPPRGPQRSPHARSRAPQDQRVQRLDRRLAGNRS